MSRIAIVSQRLLGHILPVMEIAMELDRRGHEVTILCNEMHRSLICKARVKFIPVEWEGFPEKFVNEFMLEILKHITKDNTDFILSDSAQSAPAYAAELLGIKWASFQTTVPLPDDLIPGSLTVNRRMRDVYAKYLNTVRNSYGLQPLEDPFRSRGDFAGLSPYLHLVLVSPELLITREGLPPSLHVVGYCSYEESQGEDHRILDTGTGKRIMVCTSSIYGPDIRLLTDQYVMAVVEAFRGSDFHIYVTSKRPFAGREELPKNVNWETRYPIHHVLMPAADVIVTHGGCNTLLKAMKYGRPMLIIPLGLDHHLLAEQCRKLGIAEVLEADKAFASSIHDRVMHLLTESSYQQAASAIADKMESTRPSESAAGLIERLLKSKGESHYGDE